MYRARAAVKARSRAWDRARPAGETGTLLPAQVANEIARLQGLPIGDLRALYEREFGADARTLSRDYAWKRLALRLQMGGARGRRR
jgi:hypothetical protein